MKVKLKKNQNVVVEYLHILVGVYIHCCNLFEKTLVICIKPLNCVYILS